jgi:hypothetical protein
VGIVVIVVCLVLTVLACFHPTPLLRQIRSLVGLPLLFAISAACIFCASNISAAGLLFPCTRDEVGRYAAPLVLVLPFFFATVVTAVYLFANRRGTGSEHHGVALNRFLQLEHVLLICLLFYLAAQVMTYIRANPIYTFQSFACQIAPVDDGPIIRFMQKEHIRYAWGTVWIGNAIVFRTDGRIVVADPRIITVQADNRLPSNTTVVQQAYRPAILAFALHSDAHPDLLQALSRQGVTYTVARFPSVPGLDVLVVQPDRTLAPATANALGSWFYNC